MSTKHLPRIVYLVDTSGSMGWALSLVEGKLQQAKAALKNTKPHHFGLATFSTYYNGIDWDSDVYLTRNGGDTLLYGSCIQLIQELTQRYTAADKILICVITDGGDSSLDSRATASAVAAEVGVAEDILGWDFLFLGTNTNAYEVGQRMGVKGSKTLGFANSKDGFDRMLDSLADVGTRWLNGLVGHDDSFFTEDVRSQQEKLGAISFSS